MAADTGKTGRPRKHFLAALAATILLLAASTAAAVDDGQYWGVVGVDAKIARKLKFSSDGTFRVGEDFSRLYAIHLNGEFVYRFFDFFGVGAGYKQIFERIYDDDVDILGKGWWREYRPYVSTRLEWTIDKFDFQNRQIVEFRKIEDAGWNYRYRNKLDVVLPPKWTKIEIRPFVADEIFVDLNSGEFLRNRFYAGFAASPAKHLKAKLYFLMQAQRATPDWLNFYVLGTELRVVF